MPVWVSRYLSLDDVWSVLGYVFLIVLNRVFGSPPMELPIISLLASGMLAITWIANGTLRQRNAERGPNARVAFWTIVAALSLLAVKGPLF